MSNTFSFAAESTTKTSSKKLVKHKQKTPPKTDIEALLAEYLHILTFG